MKNSSNRQMAQAKAETLKARTILFVFALAFASFCLLTQITRLIAD